MQRGIIAVLPLFFLTLSGIAGNDQSRLSMERIFLAVVEQQFWICWEMSFVKNIWKQLLLQEWKEQ